MNDSSFLSKLGTQINDSYKILIRPNKTNYHVHDLGGSTQIINMTRYTRRDFTYCNYDNNL